MIKALMVCLGFEPGAAGWKTRLFVYFYLLNDHIKVETLWPKEDLLT